MTARDAEGRRRTARALAWLVAPLAGGDTPSGRLPVIDDWPRLIGLASRHSLAPAVGAGVGKRVAMPVDVRNYFDAALWLNGDRNRMIRNGLVNVLDLLAGIGIRPVLLKGAAVLAADLYADPAARVLGDLDLLIAADAAPRAYARLEAAGFSRAASPVLSPDHHHLPMLVDPGSGAGVELHHEPLAAHARLIGADATAAAATPIMVDGRTALLPVLGHRIVHVLAHDQIGDGGYRRHQVSLRQLLDFAALAARARPDDWALVVDAFVRAGHSAVLENAEGLVLGLFGVRTPSATPALADRALARLDAALGRRRPGVAPVLSAVGGRLRRNPMLAASLFDLRRLPRRLRELRRAIEPQGW